MTARAIRRGLVAGAAAVLAVSAVVVTRSTGSTCSLDQVTAASAASDTLQAIVPWGDGILAVGSRFTGSTSGALEATVTADGTYDARMLDIFDRHIVQLDDLAVDGGQAWAVGAVTNTEPVAAHFDGSTWNAMPMADPGPNEDGLAGVAVVSPNQIWAVGRHQLDEDFVTLIERSDGRTWRVVSSPNTGSSAMLQDVVAVGPNDVWAVGWSVTEKGYHSLVEHWDGSAWTIVPTPAAGVDSLLAATRLARWSNDGTALGGPSFLLRTRARRSCCRSRRRPGASWSRDADPTGRPSRSRWPRSGWVTRGPTSRCRSPEPRGSTTSARTRADDSGGSARASR